MPFLSRLKWQIQLCQQELDYYDGMGDKMNVARLTKKILDLKKEYEKRNT